MEKNEAKLEGQVHFPADRSLWLLEFTQPLALEMAATHTQVPLRQHPGGTSFPARCFPQKTNTTLTGPRSRRSGYLRRRMGGTSPPNRSTTSVSSTSPSLQSTSKDGLPIERSI